MYLSQLLTMVCAAACPYMYCNWDSDTIVNIISECGKASPIGMKNAYKVIYQLIIGKDRGPRLGPFLASMDKQFVINRFNQAAYN